MENEEMQEDYYERHCYECRTYGDNYMYDGEGNLISACDDCFYNRDMDWEDD